MTINKKVGQQPLPMDAPIQNIQHQADGHQTGKDEGIPKLQRFPPWLPEPWGPGKSYLGFRMFLILTQDIANMLVHMFSSKLEQLKAIIIRSIKRSWQNRCTDGGGMPRFTRKDLRQDSWVEVLPPESCVGVLLQNSHSFWVRFRQWKRYFYWRWNRPQSESSQDLQETAGFYQPARAWGDPRWWCQEDGPADLPASQRIVTYILVK